MAAVCGAAIVLAASAARAEDTIKIGALATLEGAFTVLGEDSMRGVKLDSWRLRLIDTTVTIAQ